MSSSSSSEEGSYSMSGFSLRNISSLVSPLDGEAKLFWLLITSSTLWESLRFSRLPLPSSWAGCDPWSAPTASCMTSSQKLPSWISKFATLKACRCWLSFTLASSSSCWYARLLSSSLSRASSS